VAAWGYPKQRKKFWLFLLKMLAYCPALKYNKNVSGYITAPQKQTAKTGVSRRAYTAGPISARRRKLCEKSRT
jgi:hypothetical protein